MTGLLVRISLLAVGMGALEIGLGRVLVEGSVTGAIIVLVGVALVVAGSGGFIAPLLVARRKGTEGDE